MITKNHLKFIKSLQLKKNRNENGLFLVEGGKSVLEVVRSQNEVHDLLVTSEWLSNNQIPEPYKAVLQVVTQQELAFCSSFENNYSALAVVPMMQSSWPWDLNSTSFILVLDKIQDPGNLGTMIRTADWFGIEHIVCSTDCAEWYNPKTIAASMGSFLRINHHYDSLPNIYKQLNHFEWIGSDMEGENLFTTDIPFVRPIALVMGNEANGIRKELEELLHRKLTIPRYGSSTESLNVAISAGILMAELIQKKGPKPLE